MYRQSPMTMTLLLVCMTTVAPVTLAQQVYKCVKGSQTSYQSSPCEAGSASSITQVRATTAGLPWDGLRYGMSLEEVKRIASAVETPGESPRSLRKSAVLIVGIPFQATYNFDRSNQLVGVIVERTGHYKVLDLELSDNEANMTAYEKLVSFFRSKYGSETSRNLKNRDTGFPGLAADSEWAVSGGKFSVTISPVTATTSMLTLRLGFAERAQ